MARQNLAVARKPADAASGVAYDGYKAAHLAKNRAMTRLKSQEPARYDALFAEEIDGRDPQAGYERNAARSRALHRLKDEFPEQFVQLVDEERRKAGLPVFEPSQGRTREQRASTRRERAGVVRPPSWLVRLEEQLPRGGAMTALWRRLPTSSRLAFAELIEAAALLVRCEACGEVDAAIGEGDVCRFCGSPRGDA